MHLTDEIDAALRGRQLLEHPFYRRWERGELAAHELAAYASQYANWERQLPVTLRAMLEATDDEVIAASIAANLHDELSPVPHTQLFDEFADGVGAAPEPPAPATTALVDLYAQATSRGLGFAVGVVAAYEVQAAEVAATKSDGLRRHYGASAATTRFWDLHATLESAHAQWSLDAAEGLDREEVLRGVAASRDAWWGFLDERELLAA